MPGRPEGEEIVGRPGILAEFAGPAAQLVLELRGLEKLLLCCESFELHELHDMADVLAAVLRREEPCVELLYALCVCSQGICEDESPESFSVCDDSSDGTLITSRFTLCAGYAQRPARLDIDGRIAVTDGAGEDIVCETDGLGSNVRIFEKEDTRRGGVIQSDESTSKRYEDGL